MNHGITNTEYGESQPLQRTINTLRTYHPKIIYFQKKKDKRLQMILHDTKRHLRRPSLRTMRAILRALAYLQYPPPSKLLPGIYNIHELSLTVLQQIALKFHVTYKSTHLHIKEYPQHQLISKPRFNLRDTTKRSQPNTQKWWWFTTLNNQIIPLDLVQLDQDHLAITSSFFKNSTKS